MNFCTTTDKRKTREVGLLFQPLATPVGDGNRSFVSPNLGQPLPDACTTYAHINITTTCIMSTYPTLIRRDDFGGNQPQIFVEAGPSMHCLVYDGTNYNNKLFVHPACRCIR